MSQLEFFLNVEEKIAHFKRVLILGHAIVSCNILSVYGTVHYAVKTFYFANRLNKDHSKRTYCCPIKKYDKNICVSKRTYEKQNDRKSRQNNNIQAQLGAQSQKESVFVDLQVYLFSNQFIYLIFVFFKTISNRRRRRRR